MLSGTGTSDAHSHKPAAKKMATAPTPATTVLIAMAPPLADRATIARVPPRLYWRAIHNAGAMACQRASCLGGCLVNRIGSPATPLGWRFLPAFSLSLTSCNSGRCNAKRGKQGIPREEHIRRLLPAACLHCAAEPLSKLEARWESGAYSERDGRELDSALDMMGLAERLAGD